MAFHAELVNIFYKKGIGPLFRLVEMTFPALTFKKMTPGALQAALRMYQQDRQHIKKC